VIYHEGTVYKNRDKQMDFIVRVSGCLLFGPSIEFLFKGLLIKMKVKTSWLSKQGKYQN
jgi:hypothetical protein